MLTSIEGGEFLGELTNCQLLRQDSRNAVVILVAILLWIQKVQGSNIVLWTDYLDTLVGTSRKRQWEYLKYT